MKSVLISIQPKWCELIASGKKTVEVRKTAPKEVPFKAYIYCTAIKDKKYYTDEFDIPIETGMWKGNSHIVGEFICDKVEKIEPCFEYYSDGYDIDDDTLPKTCLTREKLMEYGKGKPLYGWHISELKIYDEPRELSEFTKPCNWNYDCCTCKRAVYELTKAEARLFYGCDRELTHTPTPWRYVEEE